MKALDTNLIVRFLVADDLSQAEAVRVIFLQAEQNKDVFFVPVLVLLETIWVLESAYSMQREDIIKALQGLTRMPILAFESSSAVHLFLSLAERNRGDLPDLLIGSCARQAGCDSVLTFDKKAGRTELFELLEHGLSRKG